MRYRPFLFLLLPLLLLTPAYGATTPPLYSVAGWRPVPASGRDVWSMNGGWLFLKGAPQGAQQPDYDDSSWQQVSLPHGLEPLPEEASGGVNYQGPVCYRRHFHVEPALRGKKLFLYFEGIMGKSHVYLNGRLIRESWCGYLPVICDISNAKTEGDNVIAVLADNSDDTSYPPGRSQRSLDFAYFGGLYRDCWLISHGHTFITDANYEDKKAGGGVFVSYHDVQEREAFLHATVHVRNEMTQKRKTSVCLALLDSAGRTVTRQERSLTLGAGKDSTLIFDKKITRPALWSPQRPYLYRLRVTLREERGEAIDGIELRTGIRSLEFKGKDGFFLNGKPYAGKLIGANRHQDFATLGNALPNNLHWRDAKKLRDAGLEMVRNAHYPQDPAFMDACDEMGLLVIVNTPGWQYWNNSPLFAKRVYRNIRQMVRRDRNRPCIWLWEPILNETNYPDSFALKVKSIVEEEYPYPYCYSACDGAAKGAQYYNVRFEHPRFTPDGRYDDRRTDPKVTYFTREWGDNVDDWNSHNSPSRAARSWGEEPQLVQARHYTSPPYPCTCRETLMRTPAQHAGGALWHAFDHQRGYHPDPFYGGLCDAFRQPKASYHLFRAQRDPRAKAIGEVETGAMVYFASALTPFSREDIEIYTNCDTVLLHTWGNEGPVLRWTRPSRDSVAMPHPVAVFPEAWNFMKSKEYLRKGQRDKTVFLAEGILDGKVAVQAQAAPALRPEKLTLRVDDGGRGLRADGSDVVTLIAEVRDARGQIKRLNDLMVRFDVEGEGELLGQEGLQTNPRQISWGSAPILLRSTTRPGAITLRVRPVLEGSNSPHDATLTLTSLPADYPLYPFTDRREKTRLSPAPQSRHTGTKRVSEDELRDVERGQADFE